MAETCKQCNGVRFIWRDLPYLSGPCQACSPYAKEQEHGKQESHLRV